MMKRNFWDVRNVLVTLKAMVVSILIGIVTWLITWLGKSHYMIAVIVGVVWLILSLFLWGFMANRFWKWS